jgi:hypothetical protein
MRRETKAAVCVLVLLAVPSAALAQARKNSELTERAAARVLLDNRVTPERDRALALALELGSRAGPELRDAVIAAAWAEVRGETGRAEEDESIFAYYEAVAGLRDPRAIPFLAHVLAAGGENALADLGPAAFPAVLEVVANPSETNRSRVWNGLTVLRFMLEDGSLGSRQVALVREVARDRMSGTQDNGVVMGAMRLGIALGDPELRRIVETLAADRAAAEALVSPYLSDGKTLRDHQSDVDGVQERARLLLAGRAGDIGPFRRPYPRK